VLTCARCFPGWPAVYGKTTVDDDSPDRTWERADAYALQGDERTSKALFREAFFIAPQRVDMELLESGMIRRLAAKVAALGYKGSELAEWMPVYGALLGVYRKMHIPDDPLYYEKFYFTPGDTGFRAWPTRFGRIGVLICWDQWFPEAARLTALQGAEIIFYPTAIGWHPAEKSAGGAVQHDAWETIQRAHAVANGCYVAACNRVGHEAPAGGAGLEFWGQSFVAGPQGQLLAKAGADREEIVLAQVDLAKIDDTRTHWPFLRDRRIDAYADLTRRFIDPPVARGSRAQSK